jgi:hypothetical protein
MWTFQIAGLGQWTATGIFRIRLGSTYAEALGNIQVRGWQMEVREISGQRAIRVAVHDGTTFSQDDWVNVPGSGWFLTNFVVTLVNGILRVYAGGNSTTLETPLVTMSGGPTTQSPPPDGAILLDITNGANAAAHRTDVFQFHAYSF